MNAEFEEKEYESPLNHQLLAGSHNLWAPGQVFEGNFGIDAALEISRSDFWTTVGYSSTLSGVALNNFHFGYVWRRLKKKKPLPTFKLNLFLQTKRPEGLRNRTREIKSLGINSPYWRFCIKNHQQLLLSKLKHKLKNKAFVAYGCSAFHRYSDLFHHIEHNSLVENSTFVKVDKLDKHTKWIYDKPGSIGYAMSTPEEIDERPLLEEINSIADNFVVDNDIPIDNLKTISIAISEICEELNNNEIAKEVLRRIRYLDKNKIPQQLSQFIIVLIFSEVANVNWMVIK